MPNDFESYVIREMVAESLEPGIKYLCHILAVQPWVSCFIPLGLSVLSMPLPALIYLDSKPQRQKTLTSVVEQGQIHPHLLFASHFSGMEVTFPSQVPPLRRLLGCIQESR